MKDKTIRRLFGADPNVVATLQGLAPWGLAALAAYLAGQGLVELASKIRFAPGDPPLPMTPDDITRVRQAIRELQLTNMPIETRKWIEAHPPSIRTTHEGYWNNVTLAEMAGEGVPTERANDRVWVFHRGEKELFLPKPEAIEVYSIFKEARKLKRLMFAYIAIGQYGLPDRINPGGLWGFPEFHYLYVR